MEAPIEPSAFDLVVIGTGLTESLVAAAAAKAGRSVLQIDPADHYGGAWASHHLDELLALLAASGGAGEDNGPLAGTAAAARAAGLRGAALYQASGAELGPSHQYNIDLAPKVAFGAGPLIDLLLGCGAQNYLEFKLVQGSYMLVGGQLRPVPSSRAEVFKGRSLGLLQKRCLMRFLKATAEAMEGAGPLQDAFRDDVPFSDLLVREGLDAELRQFLLHGVLLQDWPEGGGAPAVDSGPVHGSSAHASTAPQAEAAAGADQQPAQQHQPPGTEPAAACQLSAAEALCLLRLYTQSAGRYGEDTGAFLTPMYGCGELPQAFCRVAAVAGAVQVLRCGVEGLPFDEHTYACTGIELSSGQVIRCSQLAAGEAALGDFLATFRPDTEDSLTHCCCAVLDGPLLPGEHQTLVAVPPGGDAGMAAVVRGLALSHGTAVCPRGRHLLRLWTPALPPASSSSIIASSLEEQVQSAAAAALLPVLTQLADARGLQPRELPQQQQQGLGEGEVAVGQQQPAPEAAAAGAAAETASADEVQANGPAKPAVLLAAFYTARSMRLAQPDTAAASRRWPANVALCPGPDASATYVSAIQAAKQCYWQLFPAEPAASEAAGASGRGGSSDQAQFPLDLRPLGRDSEADADAASDDEALEALQATLGALPLQHAGEGRHEQEGQEDGVHAGGAER